MDGVEGPNELEVINLVNYQVAPDGWLVKGGGAAHTREKVVAAAADRFVVIADSSKVVTAIHSPIPANVKPNISTAPAAATKRLVCSPIRGSRS